MSEPRVHADVRVDRDTEFDFYLDRNVIGLRAGGVTSSGITTWYVDAEALDAHIAALTALRERAQRSRVVSP